MRRVTIYPVDGRRAVLADGSVPDPAGTPVPLDGFVRRLLADGDVTDQAPAAPRAASKAAAPAAVEKAASP